MQRKPEWLKVRVAGGAGLRSVRSRLTARGLHTVCDEARCPNRGECFGRGNATIMVLGKVCTRGCRFCSVSTGQRLAPLDPGEPGAVAAAVAELGLRYVVLTMVTRDDLPDGGAAAVAACIAAVKQRHPGVGVELLGSDFGGDRRALAVVAAAGADVLAHNIEVVRRLTPLVRHSRCSYGRSLAVLRALGELTEPAGTPIKSSLLLGLGETHEEVGETLEDLRHAGVSLVTLGQYLQPARGCWPVVEYLAPERFAGYVRIGRHLGFTSVVAGPLVRSSYGAEEQHRVAQQLGAAAAGAGEGGR
ncbi:MAG: lipoyl synthase [Deltaproteobacteria bacterium]|nr:lipoyl synthase [Deltaproteobacteria bacterium]